MAWSSQRSASRRTEQPKTPSKPDLVHVLCQSPSSPALALCPACFVVLFRKVALAPEVLEAMPYMSALSLGKSEVKATVLRVGTTGEDGFEILGPSPLLHEVATALLQTPLVRPAGVYCLDILRMEAGEGLENRFFDETLAYTNLHAIV